MKIKIAYEKDGDFRKMLLTEFEGSYGQFVKLMKNFVVTVKLPEKKGLFK